MKLRQRHSGRETNRVEPVKAVAAPNFRQEINREIREIRGIPTGGKSVSRVFGVFRGQSLLVT